MKEVNYLRYLDGENRLRIRFELERGQVSLFTVQIEDLETNWHVYRRRYEEWLKK